MPTTIIMLSFAVVFLAIFAPCVAVISKLEKARELDAWNKRRRRQAQAESDSAWILNRRIPMD